MSFDGIEATLALLMRIDLPGGPILYCDGGTVIFESETYTSEDDAFGTITGFEDFTVGQTDTAPTYEIEWTPKSTAAAVTLSSPSYQGVEVLCTIVSINRATGAVLTSKRVFTGIVDYTVLELGNQRRILKMGFSTEIDRFLNTDKGNKLNSSFHKSVWSGETGLDMTTGTTIPVPWGQKGNPRASNGGGGITQPSPMRPGSGLA